jgi:hypothetical protein
MHFHCYVTRIVYNLNIFTSQLIIVALKTLNLENLFKLKIKLEGREEMASSIMHVNRAITEFSRTSSFYIHSVTLLYELHRKHLWTNDVSKLEYNQRITIVITFTF